MNKSYAFLCKCSNLKYAWLANFKKNKILYYIALFLMSLTLITGIFVAFKCGVTSATLNDYNIVIYTCDELASFGLFFKRLLSYACMLALLTICSLVVYCVPVGFALIAYRTYLAGFNTALLLAMFGVSGAILSVIVILPAQILITFAYVMYFIIMINRAEQKKKFGHTTINICKTYLSFFAFLTLINFIETMLLIILQASTVFVL